MKRIVAPEIGRRSFGTFEKQALNTNWICHWGFQTQIYHTLKIAIDRLTPTGLITEIIKGDEGVQILPRLVTIFTASRNLDFRNRFG